MDMSKLFILTQIWLFRSRYSVSHTWTKKVVGQCHGSALKQGQKIFPNKVTASLADGGTVEPDLIATEILARSSKSTNKNDSDLTIAIS